MLDQNVDEKYYLSSSQVQKFSSSSFRKEKDRIQNKDYCDAVLSRDWKGPKLISEPLCAASRGRNPDNPSDRTVGAPTVQRLELNTTGCCNTLTSVQKDNYVVEPLLIKECTKKGYAEANCYDSISLDQPNSKTRRGRVGKQICNTLTCSCNTGVVEPQIIQVAQIYPNSGNPQAGRVYHSDGISPAMDTCSGGNRMPKIASNYRVRKLTPRECWRLMGVKDEQFDRLHDISNSQLYKLAGNSIVVDVLEAIFTNLLKPGESKSVGQLSLF